MRAVIDTRPSPLYTRTGGAYGVGLHTYVDTNDTYTFNRLDGEIVQHIPVLRETWVLSMRARIQSTLNDADVVPYFLLPSLGGGSSLRGYSSWRFRDRHSLLANVEWRWIPNRLGFDMAVFYDAGTVADRPTRFSVDDVSTDWGVGARFHAPNITALRVELARGNEGWHIIFASTTPF
jgi:outer membrane translocation and assembly module TamA